MLDLGRHYEDARRLTISHPLFRVALARGHEADDLLQSVYVGVLVRQTTRSRYDPSRASLSKYLRLVAGSVLANLLDKHRRRAKHETGSVWIRGVESDPALAAVVDESRDEARIVALLVEELGGDEEDQRVIALLCAGFSVAQVRRSEGGAVDFVLVEVRASLSEAMGAGVTNA